MTHPLKWSKISSLFLFSILILLIDGRIIDAIEAPADQKLVQAQNAFSKGDYKKVLDLVKPLVNKQKPSSQARRLKLLSLVRLGKTREGVDEYDRLTKEQGREDEELLRQMAIASILPFRSDMREQIRGATYTALKEVNSDETVPYFEEGLADGSGMIRALVAEGLGKLKAGQRSKRFRQALEDKAGLVRVSVLKGLGRSGDQSVVPLITPFLKDEQEVVQVAAAGALFLLGRNEYWGRVVRGTQVNEGYERGAALRMVGELGDPRALPILKEGLKDSQPSIRAAAAASLGNLALPQAIPVLIPILSERIPAVRSVAAVSLGKLEAKKAIPNLKGALRDSNAGVQAAALAALLRLKSPYHGMAPIVSGLIRDKNPGIRSAAAKALENGQSGDVIGTLTLLLNDPVPKPRISAVRSIGRVGGREVIPQLKRALRDNDEAVRATAAGAIARILSKPAST